MTTFTASEVRDAAIAVVARDMEYEAEMLRAYADLLEAREKAVPVAYALFTEKGLLRMWAREWFADVHGAPVNPTPLYTHPAQAQPPAASATPNLASYWRIVAEAAEVLQMVLDSGVKLPPNWRWPLLDELSGLSAMMLAAQENPNG